MNKTRQAMRRLLSLHVAEVRSNNYRIFVVRVVFRRCCNPRVYRVARGLSESRSELTGDTFVCMYPEVRSRLAHRRQRRGGSVFATLQQQLRY